MWMSDVILAPFSLPGSQRVQLMTSLFPTPLEWRHVDTLVPRKKKQIDLLLFHKIWRQKSVLHAVQIMACLCDTLLCHQIPQKADHVDELLCWQGAHASAWWPNSLWHHQDGQNHYTLRKKCFSQIIVLSDSVFVLAVKEQLFYSYQILLFNLQTEIRGQFDPEGLAYAVFP